MTSGFLAMVTYILQKDTTERIISQYLSEKQTRQLNDLFCSQPDGVIIFSAEQEQGSHVDLEKGPKIGLEVHLANEAVTELSGVDLEAVYNIKGRDKKEYYLGHRFKRLEGDS